MTDQLQPAGEALSNAIWEAAWFAVNKHRSKAEFVAMVTKAANEAFDSQVHNAVTRSASAAFASLAGTLADALEKGGQPK
jgi:hypothetical protein